MLRVALFTERGRCWEYALDYNIFILFVFHSLCFSWRTKITCDDMWTRVITCVITCDDMWLHVMTCDDMWFWNMFMWNFCKRILLFLMRRRRACRVVDLKLPKSQERRREISFKKHNLVHRHSKVLLQDLLSSLHLTTIELNANHPIVVMFALLAVHFCSQSTNGKTFYGKKINWY